MHRHARTSQAPSRPAHAPSPGHCKDAPGALASAGAHRRCASASWPALTALLIVAIAAVVAWVRPVPYPSPLSDVPRTPGPQHKRAAWDPTDVQHVDSTYCNIPRVGATSLSRSAFAEQYLEKQPVIVVGLTDNDKVFAQHVRKDVLMSERGNATVTLSSANRNSYAKIDVPLGAYLGPTYLRPQPLNATGADTWYLFGDHHTDAWRDVFQHYAMPTKYTFGPYSTLSFGIGPAGSGVPFHTHGHVFNEVVYGKKRWWLQAPSSSSSPEHSDDGPRFDPDASSLQWLHAVRPTYTDEESAALWECVCRPGEMLYIPSMWHHATLNVGETVFMAVFV